eukprot:IDg4037t1
MGGVKKGKHKNPVSTTDRTLRSHFEFGNSFKKKNLKEKASTLTKCSFGRLRLLELENVVLPNSMRIGYTVPPIDSLVWTWSRATLHRFMLSSGFVYQDRLSHYEVSKTREDIMSMRDNFLEWVQSYRIKDMTYCTKMKRSGERSILTHVISENDVFLKNCMLLYRGAKANKSDDYHTEMNWDIFSSWCQKTVFPAISAHKKNAVLVLDRASYHTKLDEED